jgi:hypothetical protein
VKTKGEIEAWLLSQGYPEDHLKYPMTFTEVDTRPEKIAHKLHEMRWPGINWDNMSEQAHKEYFNQAEAVLAIVDAAE